MSSSGDPDYEVQTLPTRDVNCGPTCLECRDCRTGLLVNMAGALPIVGTYTLDDSSTFEILEIHWLFDTLESVFLGPMNAPAGHVGHKCCKRVIGCAVIESDEMGKALMPISLEFPSYGNSDGVNNMIGVYFVEDVLGSGVRYTWFEWKREETDPSFHIANREKSFFCDLKAGVSVTLPNTQSADYESGQRYITDADGETIDVEPVFCNQDGTHTHAGGVLSPNENDSYAGIVADCNCVLASMPFQHDITFRDLNNVCGNLTMRTTATEFTYPLELDRCWEYTHPLNSPTTFETEEDLATEACPDPFFTPDTSITCDIEFIYFLDGYFINTTDTPFRFIVYMTFYDGASVYEEISGTAHMVYNCVNGLAEQTVSIDMFAGGSDPRGTIEVEVVHT